MAFIAREARHEFEKMRHTNRTLLVWILYHKISSICGCCILIIGLFLKRYTSKLHWDNLLHYIIMGYVIYLLSCFCMQQRKKFPLNSIQMWLWQKQIIWCSLCSCRLWVYKSKLIVMGANHGFYYCNKHFINMIIAIFISFRAFYSILSFDEIFLRYM